LEQIFFSQLLALVTQNNATHSGPSAQQHIKTHSKES